MDSTMNQQEELQQLRQQIEEILQQTQTSEQQIQQKIQHSEQQTRRQIEEILEKIQQLQGCVNGLVQVNNLPLDKMREILQGQEETLRRQSVIQYRIQALFTIYNFSSDFPTSQFFIILPSDNDLDRRQGRHFRLYFLCERSFYTGTEDNNEVHMTGHPGYDLKRPKEFFDKYGPYVLTMMYMFKYGAVGSGFLVPPLAQSKLVAEIEIIDQLVDDTIAYLEEMTRTMDDINTTSQWKLKHTDLDELKSYFAVNEGEHSLGNLYQGVYHSSWLCEGHHCERVMQHLKDMVVDYGGTYTDDQGKTIVKITSDWVSKEFYDSIVDVCRIQSVDHKPHLTVDWGRLLLTIGASREVQDTVMTIKQLSGLTGNDLKFIQQCNLTQLAIEFTPQEADEDRLTNIMQQSPKLRELRIGCRCERSLAIIKLVISSREKALQNGGQSALHVLEVTGEGLEPFDLYRGYQERGHVTSKVTFSKESSTPDMDTCINLQNEQLAAEGDWMCNFFRQYGWSISSLEANWTFSDHLATLWDDATQILGSRLKQLDLAPSSLQDVGLDALDRIIRRSQRLVTFNLRLDLGLEYRHEKSKLLLGRYGGRLNKLMLYGDSIQQWLPFAQAIASRTSFPVMNGFSVESWKGEREVPYECTPWLATMVSTPPQLPGITQETMKPSVTLTRLKAFELTGVTLHPRDWETVIKAIDFSELETLNLNGTNISQEQLDLLIERIAGIGTTLVPLKDLNLKQTDSLADTDKDALRAKIQKVAPQVSISGL